MTFCLRSGSLKITDFQKYSVILDKTFSRYNLTSASLRNTSPLRELCSELNEMSGEYAGCGRTCQPNFNIFVRVTNGVCGLTLSWLKTTALRLVRCERLCELLPCFWVKNRRCWRVFAHAFRKGYLTYESSLFQLFAGGWYSYFEHRRYLMKVWHVF